MSAPEISLYPDQMELVNRVRDGYRKHKWQLLQSPTGSGKSRMGAYIAANAIMRGRTVAFDVPMKELRKQIHNTFQELGINHSFIASGFRYNPFAECWISTTQTIAGRLDRIPKIDLLITDEAHQGGEARRRLIAAVKAQGGWGLGLSATPERLDGSGLDEFYDDMILGQPLRWLIDNKRLSEYRLFSPSRPDLSAVRKSGNGEYVQSDVQDFMEHQTVLIGDSVKHYTELAQGKRNVSYCASIKHSQMVCQAFRDAGIPSAHIDGTMDDAERTKIIKAYARREILNLCNADLLLYGFDLAAASGDKNAVVESISDLKPTMSKAMQFQKLGRALRYKPYAAMIFDHAGNTFNPDGSAKHGMPCSPVEWNWRGREKKSGASSERTIPVRQCCCCYMVHRPSPACPACGHVYEVAGRMVEQVDGELMEVTADQLAAIAKQERQVQGRADTFEALLELEARKGNKRGWAENVWTSRGNSKHGLAQRRAAWKAGR